MPTMSHSRWQQSWDLTIWTTLSGAAGAYLNTIVSGDYSRFGVPDKCSTY